MAANYRRTGPVHQPTPPRARTGPTLDTNGLARAAPTQYKIVPCNAKSR